MKILMLVLLALIQMSCNHNTLKDRAHPSYYSVIELKEPIIFDQGKIKTNNGICFSSSGDILYTSGQVDKKFDNGRFYAGIFESRYEDGKWTEPKQVPFDWAIDAYHPVLSIDNDVLFFNSRSRLDSANKSIPHNIWAAHKSSSGWSLPEQVAVVNSSAHDSYPSVARNNNLYFNSDRAGGKGSMDIYVSYVVDGKYQQPVNLEKLNSSDVENDLVVDPDERFIIFNRYIDSTKAIDLYISFRKDNTWTTPRKLDNINSNEAWELTPTLSPDGKYFFYECNGNIMQVDLASIIYHEELEGVGLR